LKLALVIEPFDIFYCVFQLATCGALNRVAAAAAATATAATSPTATSAPRTELRIRVRLLLVSSSEDVVAADLGRTTIQIPSF